ncbi:S-adenosyl-L-methionine-dependent methyltransferase [Stemphylium lycopersici]|uniref:S-adenosyl-L-methionine-dependent methyltransferase n=1 Tax=Stemphylium lycopersici TaxID=183478 RepID=A0A364NCP3_STELY|nr:S-adenosyl-L-methionine-dependent methyltransferase [Stemphylium lycopersici]RAR15095.1 S-adenosyl-L-methionine-dependent methyltransferase [Stemphylium lycopersici]
MEAAITQIRDLYAKSDARERQEIQEQVRDLQKDLYNDWEMMFGLAVAPFQWALVDVGIDLNIFTSLASSTAPITHSEFQEMTKAAPNLLSHVLRSMASFGLIAEVSKDTFAANRTTRVFANPHVIGAVPHVSKLHLPVMQAIPEYLKEHKYQDITDSKDLPFHTAMKTKLTPFEWMKQDGEQMKALGHVMVLDSVNSWVASYPAEEVAGNFKPESDSALLVDIGGGFGQHSVAFKKKFSTLPGRIVVQDVPSTLAHAQAVDGIDFQAHDFFTAQPIRGAKFYYLRHIMHDWTDEDCVRILSKIAPAMGPESRILVDEVVLPDTKVPWQVAMMDLAMMAALGGIERSKEDWVKLLGKAGLRVMDVHCYDEVRYHSIVTAVPM